MVKSAWLDDRGLIKVGGPEAVPFLQGLISNDITKVAPGRAIYAALLTPQGKFLHDFFISAADGGMMIECEADRRSDLFTRLRRYKLRSKVELADVTEDWAVLVAWGEGAAAAFGVAAEPGAAAGFGGGLAYTDPRHAGLGVRLLVPAGAKPDLPPEVSPGSHGDYERLRLSLGIPSGPEELPVERAFLLESGFDELNGIDWHKGCYVGQEVTARTKYRGLLRRRLTPVTVEGAPPADDSRIMADGRDAGELRAVRDGQGLAMIRLDALAEGKTLRCGDAIVTPRIPDWWTLPVGTDGGTEAAE
jgi:folate-binding protein YgfZ